MDIKIYTIPIISIVVLLSLIVNPRITGNLVGKTQVYKITANASITIAKDGFIPENSKVLIYLDSQNTSINIKDFIEMSGGEYKYEFGHLNEINYEGFGFSGEYSYSVDMCKLNISCFVPSGEHNLTIEIVYKNFVISNYTEKIIV